MFLLYRTCIINFSLPGPSLMRPKWLDTTELRLKVSDSSTEHHNLTCKSLFQVCRLAEEFKKSLIFSQGWPAGGKLASWRGPLGIVGLKAAAVGTDVGAGVGLEGVGGLGLTGTGI